MFRLDDNPDEATEYKRSGQETERGKMIKLFQANRRNLNFFSDGGLRLHPPAASSAVVVKDHSGQVVDWFSRLLPPMSSMEAEYHGLLDALAVAGRQTGLERACFHLDNQPVVGQVTGDYQVRGPKLRVLHDRVTEAIKRLQSTGCQEIEFYYVPREYNRLADALAADVLLLLPADRRLRPAQFQPNPTRPDLKPKSVKSFQ